MRTTTRSSAGSTTRSGAVLDALGRAGLADNTIVVLEADHGVSLGERGRLQKHTFFPEVHRVPRLVAFPGRLPAGQVRGDLCELDGPRPHALRPRRHRRPPPASAAATSSPTRRRPSHVFATVGFGEPESRALPNQVVGTWTDGTGWPRRGCIRTARYRLDMTVRHNGAPTRAAEEDPFLADCALDPFETVEPRGRPALRGRGRHIGDRAARTGGHGSRAGLRPDLLRR